YKAAARGKNALALGSNALAHLENSVAIGYNSSVGAANSVSFGSSGATRRLMYVSAGTSETDAANFGQLLKSASLNGSTLQFYTNALTKAFDVDLSSLSGAGGAGGTAIGGGNVAYDATGNGTLTLKSSTGSTIASIAGFTDKYTTGVTLTGNTVTFTRNDGGTYSFDLPASAGGGGMSSLKADIATNKAGIAANQAAISGIEAQNGVVASTGTPKADEFVRGTAVYDYLHGDTIALGKGSTATGMNSIAIGFGNQVKGKGSGAFGDPTTITGSGSYSVGNNNTIGGDNTFVLGNNVNTTANNAVVLGNNSEGVENAVSVGAKGNERQIKNVADGTADSDAVTVRQLNKVAGFGVNTIDAELKAANTRITQMDSKVNKVGAGAAALAALHPLDMDNKFDVAAGFGNYRNANALALGVFYRPAENVMLSAGGAMGNGENMVNVGVTFALDKGEGVRVSKAAMAKKINALTDENAAMKEKLAAQDTEIGALKAALARLEAKMK
ncbi:MAG: YadA-like family protein, partial [Succiniclasticum sp.]|nr:YadA-like family protein [Succiniclasticum sp.]